MFASVCVHDIVAGSPRKRFHGYGTAAHVTDTSRSGVVVRGVSPAATAAAAAAATDTPPTTTRAPGKVYPPCVTGKRNVDCDLTIVAELSSLHRRVSFACEYDHGADARASFEHIHRNMGVCLDCPCFDL